MKFFKQVSFFLKLTKSKQITRRYLVVNGFDGAMTMLGLIFGFVLSNSNNLSTVLNVCGGAAIALAMSGISSAYVSESAEQQHALGKLEGAMITNLQDSAQGKAARYTPIIVALINGASPLLISLVILSPIFLATLGFKLPLNPLYCAIIVAMLLIFFLGVFLGRIAGISWFRSGLRTLVIAVLTAAIIYLFAG